MPDCAECGELLDTLREAHAAFQREKARADALQFELDRCQALLSTLEVEAELTQESE